MCKTLLCKYMFKFHAVCAQCTKIICKFFIQRTKLKYNLPRGSKLLIRVSI